MITACENESCKYNSDGECYYDRGLDHDEQGRCLMHDEKNEKRCSDE